MDPLMLKVFDLLLEDRIDEAKTILAAEIARFEEWADQRDRGDDQDD